MDGVARLQEAAFDRAAATGDRDQVVDLYGLAHDAPTTARTAPGRPARRAPNTAGTGLHPFSGRPAALVRPSLPTVGRFTTADRAAGAHRWRRPTLQRGWLDWCRRGGIHRIPALNAAISDRYQPEMPTHLRAFNFPKDKNLLQPVTPSSRFPFTHGAHRTSISWELSLCLRVHQTTIRQDSAQSEKEHPRDHRWGPNQTLALLNRDNRRETRWHLPSRTAKPILPELRYQERRRMPDRRPRYLPSLHATSPQTLPIHPIVGRTRHWLPPSTDAAAERAGGARLRVPRRPLHLATQAQSAPLRQVAHARQQ